MSDEKRTQPPFRDGQRVRITRSPLGNLLESFHDKVGVIVQSGRYSPTDPKSDWWMDVLLDGALSAISFNSHWLAAEPDMVPATNPKKPCLLGDTSFAHSAARRGQGCEGCDALATPSEKVECVQCGWVHAVADGCLTTWKERAQEAERELRMGQPSVCTSCECRPASLCDECVRDDRSLLVADNGTMACPHCSRIVFAAERRTANPSPCPCGHTDAEHETERVCHVCEATCSKAPTEQVQPASDASPTLLRFMIDFACLRHCDYCNDKIDRGYPPPGYEWRDPDDLWPYWHNHRSTCPLRIEAERLGIPTAVSKRPGRSEREGRKP